MGDKLVQGGDIAQAFLELRESVGRDVKFYGALVDKDINERAADRATLDTFFSSVGLVDVECGGVRELFEGFHGHGEDDMRILVCGSLFLLREVFQVCDVPAPLSILG